MKKNLMFTLTRHLLAGATIVASFGAHAQSFAPIVSASNIFAEAGSALHLSGSVTDPNYAQGIFVGSTQWLYNGQQLATTPIATVSWATLASVGISTVGTYNITLVATDTFGASSTSIIFLQETVTQPPTIQISTPLTGIVGQAITLTGTATSVGQDFGDPLAATRWTYQGKLIATNPTQTVPWSTLAANGINGAGTYQLTFVAFDALNNASTAFSTLTLSDVAPVPEPETYAMLLAGLGLLGFVARRRKQQAA